MYHDTVWRRFVVDDEVIDEGDISAVIQPLWWSVSLYDGETEMYDALERFSLPQRYAWAVKIYLNEAENNGHEQFFAGYAGIVWELAAEALEAIGCDYAAEILTEAAGMLGTPSPDPEERRIQLARRNPDFEELDNRLCSVCSTAENMLCSYIARHRREFYFDDEIEVPADFYD